jgi:hypothetical protein
MLHPHEFAQIVAIGIGATAVMDAWLALLVRLGVPTTSFALVGRWIAHLLRGRFAHAAIAKAEPVAFELGLGWVTHYAIGIAYAGLLVAVQGIAWLDAPTFLPDARPGGRLGRSALVRDAAGHGRGVRRKQDASADDEPRAQPREPHRLRYRLVRGRHGHQLGRPVSTGRSTSAES